MNCIVERLGTLPIVIASGRLDAGAAPVFDEAMMELRSAPEPRILMDLTELTYVSSAGLRSILYLVKHATASGGRLGLFGACQSVTEVLEISGFTSILDVYPDREAALAASV